MPCFLTWKCEKKIDPDAGCVGGVQELIYHVCKCQRETYPGTKCILSAAICFYCHGGMVDIQFGLSCFFARPEEMYIVPDIASQFPFVTHLEMRGEYPFLFPGTTSTDSLMFYKKILKESRLNSTIHSTFYDINLATLNPYLKDANIACVKQFIDYAEILESEVVVVHCGVVSKEMLFSEVLHIEEKAEASLCESLCEIGDYAGRIGVKVGLENLPPMYDKPLVVSPRDHIRILDRINHPQVGAVFDFGHAFLGGLNLYEYLQEISPYLVGIHAHNNNGKNDDHMGLEGGKINYTRILNHPDIKGVPFIMELLSYEEVVKTLEWIKTVIV